MGVLKAGLMFGTIVLVAMTGEAAAITAAVSAKAVKWVMGTALTPAARPYVHFVYTR